jgi:hypothetical protein
MPGATTGSRSWCTRSAPGDGCPAVAVLAAHLRHRDLARLLPGVPFFTARRARLIPGALERR